MLSIRALRAACAVLALVLSTGALRAAEPPADDATLRTLVEADWAAQEKRLARKPHDPEAITSLLHRTSRLLDDQRRARTNLAGAVERFAELQNEANSLAGLDESARLDLYRRIRWFSRDLALANPLVASKPLIFMERRRFACQMLHEYLGYYHGDMHGGGVYLLEKPGKSLAMRDLLQGRLPRGTFATLALSYDARTIYFAFAQRDAEKPSFYDPKPGQRFFQLYAMDADGRNLRRLTDDQFDNFDPCPLPDGGLAFMSSRRGLGFIRCSGEWEPIPAYTLHRMDTDGRNIRTLSFHETNEWHPSVLNDGRLVYIRWDYVDRSAANYHGLWTCNPDGSNPASLFGNYTTRINACYQPRSIPGSDRILFVAGAHHADVGGALVLLNPSATRLDPTSGEDRFDNLEVLTPEVCFPEAPGWPDSYFHSPWPLSENYYLVSFGFGKIPGMSSGGKEDTTGLYYFDRFGNLELLYRSKGIGCMYPIPLAPRPVPPTLPSLLDRNLGEEGEFMLADVSEGLFPLPESRRIRELRIWQVLPKSNTHIANDPRIGHANAESARLLLGSVPVESDGSAYFRAPARKPIYLQAIDEQGKAVNTMRSITYLQPGERRGCVGCHERPGASAAATQTLAMKRAPSLIEPGPDGTRPINYVRLVQPLLDQHCVDCHDGTAGEGKSPLVLTGDREKKSPFSRSYVALRPFVRWQEWGGDSIDQTATRPGRGGADLARLPQVLADPTHRDSVKLGDAERRRLYLWLDGNVPFYGTYDKRDQEAQFRGEIVPEPAVQ